MQEYVKSVSIAKQVNSGKHVIHTLTSDSPSTFQRVRVQDYVKSVAIGKQVNSGKHVIHTLTSDSLPHFNVYVCKDASSPYR